MKDNRLFSKACSHAIFCYKRLYGYTHIDYFNQDKGLLISTTQNNSKTVIQSQTKYGARSIKSECVRSEKMGFVHRDYRPLFVAN